MYRDRDALDTLDLSKSDRYPGNEPSSCQRVSIWKRSTCASGARHTRVSEETERVLVDLAPDTAYQFQVCAVHELKKEGQAQRSMLVDGTRVVSQEVRTRPAEYARAWSLPAASRLVPPVGSSPK